MDINAGMSFETIQKKINEPLNGNSFVFQKGDYVWDQALVINRSNVELKVAPDAKVNIATTSSAHGIIVQRTTEGPDPKLKLAKDFNPHSVDAASGRNYIVVDEFPLGDVKDKFVQVNVKVSGETFGRTLLFVADEARTVGGENRIFIKKKVSESSDPNESLVEYNFDNFKYGIPASGASGAAEVFIREPLRNVTIDGFNIKYLHGTLDKSVPTDYSDPVDRSDNTESSAIYARGTYNLSLKNIKITDALSHGISVISSVGANGANIEIDGAYDKSEGGNGYGLSFTNSNASLFNGMTIKNVRHAVLFSEGASENFNYIGVKDTNRDINFHGGYDWNNTFEVDNSSIDDYHNFPGEEYYIDTANRTNKGQPTNYPENSPATNRALYEERNHVTFKNFKGSKHDNDIRAHKDGGILKGGSGNDQLYGAAGDDTLEGGTGSDRMSGEKGDDIYSVDNSADQVIEKAGEGYDRVYTTASFTLAAGQEVELVHILGATNTAALNLNGNEFNQTLVGNAGNNTLDGRGGADTMTGGAGNDIYGVENGGDQVIERSGGGYDRVYTNISYALATGQEIELLHILGSTGTAALNITGNEFGQQLSGNNGNNVLDGRGGADVLAGGGGRDTFVFSTALGTSNVDRIEDFVTDVDTIRLSGSVFSGLSAGDLAADRFKDISTGTLDANDRILYKSSTGELFYDSDGSGSATATRFAILDGNPTVKFSDFEIA